MTLDQPQRLCWFAATLFVAHVFADSTVTIPLEGDYSGIFDDVDPNYDGKFQCNFKDNAVELDMMIWPVVNDTRWKTVPYYLRGNFTTYQRRRINAAVDIMRKIVPCVEFFELDKLLPQRESYVIFQISPERCFTRVGRLGYIQPIALTQTCMQNMRALVHFWFHTMGLHHEHIRPDREEFIQVHEDNIDYDGYNYGQYSRKTEKEYVSPDVKYNPKSIMHPGPLEHSHNGKETFTVKENPNIAPDKPVIAGPFTNLGLQWSDVERLRKFYNCGS